MSDREKSSFLLDASLPDASRALDSPDAMRPIGERDAFLNVLHAPENYICPFCLLVAGVEDARVLSVQSDIVYRNEGVTAFIGARQWANNKGHVLIVPNAHFENLYDLPDALGAKIHRAARKVALAMKAAYRCEGISTRQHNEPAGNQDVWHYHLHVFPRYANDHLYRSDGQIMAAEERAIYAQKLRAYL